MITPRRSDLRPAGLASMGAFAARRSRARVGLSILLAVVALLVLQQIALASAPHFPAPAGFAGSGR